MNKLRGSEVFKGDGGVDASILEGKGPSLASDELLTSGTRFQIKTGAFDPWRPSTIKSELFGKTGQRFQDLGSCVQQILRDGKRFVYVCFGTDFIDKDLRKARENLTTTFKACGYPNAQVDVWGQTQLIGLFQRYPSLCLRLRGVDQQGFR